MRKKATFLFLLFGFLAYFILASTYPFLHNHPVFSEDEKSDVRCSRHCEKGEHDKPDKKEPFGDRKDCPACNFLTKAFYATLANIVNSLSDIYPAHIQTIPVCEFFYSETCFLYFTIRAPPISFL